MIAVETDTVAAWGEAADWGALADEAARAAITHSRYAALSESALSVEVSVKLTDDAEVQALNAAYRNRNAPTNVLSFPMLDAALLPDLAAADEGEILLGDVVIAHGVCASEAAARDISVAAHTSHLVVHGVLHLLGYDHEQGDEQAEAMESVERDALASIGIADPYEATEVRS